MSSEGESDEALSEEEIDAEADELEKEWEDSAPEEESLSGSLMPWLVPFLLIVGFILIVLLVWLGT